MNELKGAILIEFSESAKKNSIFYEFSEKNKAFKMKINTALILCAGYGKRLNPLTLDIPKPLLEINEVTLLENTINLLQDLGIKKVILNTFYLKEKIYKFIKKKDFHETESSVN